MSYSFFANEVDPDGDVAAQLEAAAAVGVPEPQATNAANAIAAAIAAATALLPTVCRPGDTASVSISGHANEGCNPTPGWSDCAVTVSITQHPAH